MLFSACCLVSADAFESTGCFLMSAAQRRALETHHPGESVWNGRRDQTRFHVGNITHFEGSHSYLQIAYCILIFNFLL